MVVVTGASGYVGEAVQRALLARGHRVRALSRRGRALPGADGVAVDLVRDDLAPALAGADAVIHLVGIIREDPAHGVTFERLHVTATERVLAAAQALAIPRVVHMSALGTGPRAESHYFRTKWKAEELVRARAPAAVIVRPSLVFGGGAPFFTTLRGLARQPVVPVPGSGRAPFDPVFREDLAQALAALAEDAQSAGETYEIGGPRRFTLDGLVDLAAAANGRPTPVPKVHLPLGALRPLVAALEGWSAFPLTLDQLQMLNQPNITDDRRWHRFVPDPRPPGTDL